MKEEGANKRVKTDPGGAASSSSSAAAGACVEFCVVCIWMDRSLYDTRPIPAPSFFRSFNTDTCSLCVGTFIGRRRRRWGGRRRGVGPDVDKGMGLRSMGRGARMYQSINSQWSERADKVTNESLFWRGVCISVWGGREGARSGGGALYINGGGESGDETTTQADGVVCTMQCI